MDHPNTRALYEYWDSLREGRDAPYRSEIDPRKISGALESMFILESFGNGAVRFRLAGTRLCEVMGMEMRGMRLSAMMARESADDMKDLARRVLETPGVGLMNCEAQGASGARRQAEILLLPLRNELGEMNRLLGCANLMESRRRRVDLEPLRFRCLDARLHPLDIERAPAAGDAEAGFAEEPVGFARQGEAAPRLRSIEGDRRPSGVVSPSRDRSHLKVVKD